MGKYTWHVLPGKSRVSNMALFPPLHTGCSCKFSICQITETPGWDQGSHGPGCTKSLASSHLPQCPLPVIFAGSGCSFRCCELDCTGWLGDTCCSWDTRHLLVHFSAKQDLNVVLILLNFSLTPPSPNSVRNIFHPLCTVASCLT